MARADPQESGIYAWMASVRASMANDPCRQLFEDQVQTHAFIFLDDYLEHIVAGPKQAPIIELVKTPGRKKKLPRRTRAATAAATRVGNATLLSLEHDDPPRDAVPVNNFHRALLQAKEATQETQNAPTEPNVIPNGSVDNTHGRTASVRIADSAGVTVSTEPQAQACAMPLQQYSKDSSIHFAVPEGGTDLSVIAEGDESPERVHANVHPSFAMASHQGRPSDAPPRDSSRSAKHSATKRTTEIIAVDNNNSGDHVAGARHRPHESQSSEVDTSHHTEPLPPRADSNSPRYTERNAFTAPLPVVPVSNSVQITNVMSVPLNDLAPRRSAPKGGTTAFPTLPAPSPLRKSVRVPQEVPTGVALPTPAAAAVPLGKRTSWLMKAREAKAMERTIPGITAATASAAFPQVSTAVKRKSGEMLGALPLGLDFGEDQRKLKVAKSVEVSVATSSPVETETRGPGSLPLVHGGLVSPASVAVPLPIDRSELRAMNADEQTTHLVLEDGFIDLFKRTVEGLGARAGKSMGKSLGGAAAAALAEARAAAEAKVAERNKVDNELGDFEVLHDDALPEQDSLPTRPNSDDHTPDLISPRAKGAERRLSLSDFAADSVQPAKPERPAKAAQARDSGAQDKRCDESISTTPPDSPPSKGSPRFVKPAGPVFNKPPPPPPVFMPPASKESSGTFVCPKESPSLNFPPNQFTLPAAVPLGIPAQLPPFTDVLPCLAQTSQASVQPSQINASSEPTFGNRDGISVWTVPSQDTIKPQLRDNQYATVDDDDDSWPLEEKLAAVEPGWRPFDFSNVDKEDTWSSLPTESQGPTRTYPMEKNGDVVEAGAKDNEVRQEQEIVEISDTEQSVMEIDELEEAAQSGMAGLRLVEPISRSTSQTSTASFAPSVHTQAGFLNQATKLVTSMLGGSKKAKPELKSLQLAAAAAKKQQEEADKKMQRQKDMEVRRQMVLAKKAEERTRLLEEERKSKEDSEKRKRDREENPDRRPLKLLPSTKAEDDTSKKRRLAPETKRLETKKPPSKDKKDPAPQTKGVVTPAVKLATQKGAKVATTALVSSTAYNTTQNAAAAPSAKPTIPEAKPFKVVPSSQKGKGKAKPQDDDMSDKLPSSMVQSQMAARAKAQMQAAKLSTPEVPSESIELPDINSEYSDSGDEDRARTFDPPGWAQSPELRQALQMQSTVNPDDIFGAIRPLRMEEMFRTRQSRFRARTSSANWSGADRLTLEEIREYERRMGFQTRAS